MRFFLVRAGTKGPGAARPPAAAAGVRGGATVPQPLYPVIFNPLPGLRKTSSGSVREPSGNGLGFLRKVSTLAPSAFPGCV